MQRLARVYTCQNVTLLEITCTGSFMSRKSDSPYRHIDPYWSSLEEFGSFEDFTAFYITIDNADPMLVYLDQTPAKYLHPSCIFSSCGLSNSLISSHIKVHPLLLTKPSSFCITNIFQSISRAIAD